jgi:amidase
MKLSEYANFDGLGLAELVRRGEVNPKELKDAALAAIEQLNPKLNSVINILADQAEKEIETGLPDGPFKGVPFLIKEVVLHAAGIPVNMGSRLAKGLTLPHDTELMSRFRKAGLVTVGTTPTPEFGYNANTEAILHGSTHNPWNTDRSPGGSSGGSAASVAAGIVPHRSISSRQRWWWINTNPCILLRISWLETHSRPSSNRTGLWRIIEWYCHRIRPDAQRPRCGCAA